MKVQKDRKMAIPVRTQSISKAFSILSFRPFLFLFSSSYSPNLNFASPFCSLILFPLSMASPRIPELSFPFKCFPSMSKICILTSLTLISIPSSSFSPQITTTEHCTISVLDPALPSPPIIVVYCTCISPDNQCRRTFTACLLETFAALFLIGSITIQLAVRFCSRLATQSSRFSRRRIGNGIESFGSITSTRNGE